MIAASRDKTAAAMKILDGQLAKTPFVAGESFSMGDIPVACVTYRFRRLAPEYPKFANLERWYAAIEQRPPFRQHVLAVPFV
jgi:glutathione S-transferase